MSCSIYLSLTGEKQGCISSGCGDISSIGNKCQVGHLDEIFVYSVNYGIQMMDNKSLSPLTIAKPIDKSSPLLFQAVNDNEMMQCEFNFYRLGSAGFMENYYKIKLQNARIIDIHVAHPHSMTHNDSQPEEIMSFQYSTLTIEHVIANTSGWVAWRDM